MSGAALPLMRGDEAFGALLFLSKERNTFTLELTQLLQRLVDNVSFALENFDRADAKRLADERIEYLASHDSLTDLPNREMFNGCCAVRSIAAARYRQLAVLFIDLDRFKVINDSLGHDAGDMLLVEIGGRLRRALRASDVVARLGGDEFVVILEEAAEPRGRRAHCRRACFRCLSQPVQLSGHECHITASIGMAMYPSDGTDMQTLTKQRRHGDVPGQGRRQERLPLLHHGIQDPVDRAADAGDEPAPRAGARRVPAALSAQDRLTSGQITGVEALLRWRHPGLGTMLAVRSSFRLPKKPA